MDEEDRYTRITLRIPKDLHGKLQQSSDATSKSMNAEIIGRLQESFNPALSLNDASVGELVDQLLKRFPPDQILISMGPGAKKKSNAILDVADAPTPKRKK